VFSNNSYLVKYYILGLLGYVYNAYDILQSLYGERSNVVISVSGYNSIISKNVL